MEPRSCLIRSTNPWAISHSSGPTAVMRGTNSLPGYRYAIPPRLPAGSKVRATGWFDNSPNNPAHPDATKLVKWGPQTTDEMMIGYVEYYYATEPSKIAER